MEQLRAYIELKRLMGYTLRDIAAMLGMSHDCLRQIAVEVEAGSPLKIKREVVMRDRGRSSCEEVAAYLNELFKERMERLMVEVGEAEPLDVRPVVSVDAVRMVRARLGIVEVVEPVRRYVQAELFDEPIEELIAA